MKVEIIQFIINEFHAGDPDMQIDSNEDLLSSGIVESIAMMQLIQFVEERFDFRVAPKEMTIENFIDVDSIVTYIINKKS